MSGKGYIYTLEVLIAVSVIFVSMVFIFKDSSQTAPAEEISIKSLGSNALDYLYDNGNLREIVIDNDQNSLMTELGTLLPGTVDFEARICESSCGQVNLPNDRDIVVVEKYISASGDVYIGKKVRVWLWGRI